MNQIKEELMYKNPYQVEPSENPKQAIKFALERGLIERHRIDPNIVNNYLKSKSNIPIWILEAACNINNEDINIPIKYQVLWFCLDKNKLKRRLNKKKVLSPILSFSTVYIEPSVKIIKTIKQALSIIGTKKELGRLCSVKRQTVYQWIAKKTKPSLLGLLKICQILNKNIWDLIENHKLYSYSATNKEFLVFKNYPENQIIDILTWIKLEGHLNLKNPYTETSQKNKDVKVLELLKEKIKKLYKIKENHFLIYDNSTKKGTIKDWSGFKLVISSAPLRQILCLRYGIPLGYKCSFIELSKEIESCKTKEDKFKLISTVIETEGSLTFSDKIKQKNPVISVTSASKILIQQLKDLFDGLGYKVKIYPHNINDCELRIHGLNLLTKLYFDIYKYFNHPSKKKRFLDLLCDKNALIRLRIKNSPKITKLIRETRIITKKSKNLNRDLVDNLNKKMESVSDYKISRHVISGWINQKKSPTLLPIFLMCKITKKDIFSIIPKYHAPLVWANGLISLDNLNKIRGSNDDGTRL